MMKSVDITDLKSVAVRREGSNPSTHTRYADDKIYTTHEFYDETSQSDPVGTWNGNDSYIRLYRCRVPRRMLEKAKETGDFIKIQDWLVKHECTEGVWL